MEINPLPFGAHLVTSERVAEIEQHLKVRFPDQYRHFLVTHNGGETEPCTFNIPDRGIRSVLNCFFGIDVFPDDDLLKHASILQGRIPAGYLPIGDDPGGNMICIGVQGPQTGQIFFWDHELELTPKKSLFYLAPSFNAFLQSLHE